MPNAKPNKKSKEGNVNSSTSSSYMMESNKQQSYDLMHDNPIDNRGSFMSKHSNSSPFQHQGYNARLDDSLGAKHGKKSQDMKSRRDESEAMEHHFGNKKFSGNKHSH